MYCLLKGECQVVVNGCAVWGKICRSVASNPAPFAVVAGRGGLYQQFVVTYPAEVEAFSLFAPSVIHVVAQRNHVVCRAVIVVEPKRAVEVAVVSFLSDEYAICSVGACFGLHNGGVDDALLGHHERLVGEGCKHYKLVLLSFGVMIDGFGLAFKSVS